MVVIDENGVNLGTIGKDQALNMAQEKGLDLVEIDPNGRPPICKIMDYGKFKYDQAKKIKESRAKQKETELKEIRLTAKIGDHDLEYKAKNARSFFDDGDQVKVAMRLRGRENIFVENAYAIFAKFAEMTGLAYERPPLRAGNQITAMMTKPKVDKEKATPIIKQQETSQPAEPAITKPDNHETEITQSDSQKS